VVVCLCVVVSLVNYYIVLHSVIVHTINYVTRKYGCLLRTESCRKTKLSNDERTFSSGTTSSEIVDV
jgi:hypothetical protein